MPLRWYDTTAPWNDCRPHPRVYDHYYGHGLRLSDLPKPTIGHLRSGYLQPWLDHPGRKRGESEIQIGKDCFHVAVDVQHFEPKELVVKVVQDQLIIEGKHEEKPDVHGYITRHFVRRYHIPKDIQVKAMNCTLTTDGVLIISAPKAPPIEDEEFRTIPIKTTGVPVIRHPSGCPLHAMSAPYYIPSRYPASPLHPISSTTPSFPKYIPPPHFTSPRSAFSPKTNTTLESTPAPQPMEEEASASIDLPDTTPDKTTEKTK